MTTKHKIPRRAVICGVPFVLAITATDGSGGSWEPDKEHKTFGETDVNERVIRFNPNQSAVQLHHTRLHEYVHAVLGASGISELLSEQVEEAIAVALEHGLGPLITFR